MFSLHTCPVSLFKHVSVEKNAKYDERCVVDFQLPGRTAGRHIEPLSMNSEGFRRGLGVRSLRIGRFGVSRAGKIS